MARRRDAESAPLEIEILDGSSLDEEPVEFGRRAARGEGSSAPGPRNRRVWTLVGALVGVGAVAAVMLVVLTSDDSSSAPETSVRPSTTRRSTIPATVTDTTGFSPDLTPFPQGSVPEASTVFPTVPEVPGSFPPFVPEGREIGPLPSLPTGTGALGAVAGETLYLWDTASGPTAVVAYDMATGTALPVDLGEVSGPIRAVVPTPFGGLVDVGQVKLIGPEGIAPNPYNGGDEGVADFTQTGPRIAASPDDGSVWVRTLEPPGLRHFDDRGLGVETLDLPLGIELIGVDRNGRPVVRGADLRSFAIETDGESVPFADGITTPVEQGNYAALVCEPPASCVVSLHSRGVVSRFGLPDAADLARTAVRFAPGGSRVAIARDGYVRIVDMIAGTSVDVPLEYIPIGDRVFVPAANYFRIARDLVWTADGEALGVLTDQGIVFVDMTGTPIARVVIDPDNPLRYVPLALG